MIIGFQSSNLKRGVMLVAAGQWADWRPDDSRPAESPALASSNVPFMLDLANSMKRKAVSSRLQR